MGTRGALGFVADGDTKVTYNHFDSYPEGLGLVALRAVREYAKNPEALYRRVRALRVVAEDSEPTDADIECLRGYANLSVSDRRLNDWYCLLRNTQGNPDAILDAGVAIDASKFPANSLFCEWGYVIDADLRKLEVYRGFQGEPHRDGRFATWPTRSFSPGVGPYYPIRLVATYDFADLPTDEQFLAALVQPDED